MLADLGLGDPADLATPTLGQGVTAARSSRVRRLASVVSVYFIKTYEYPSHADRWRGALRNTFLKPSRARREWDALAWQRRAGLPTAEPVLAWEERRCGWLHRAVLVTREAPGTPLDRLLPTLPPARQAQVGRAVGDLVRRLHELGFRDRNLDLRNLLAAPVGAAWQVANIDSPRFRLVRPGPPHDRLAHADWARLRPQFAPFPSALAALDGAAAEPGPD